MDQDDPFDPSELIALVLDQNHYHRSISLEQLRSMGFRRAVGAPDPIEGWEQLLTIKPSVVLVEWDAASGGLDFVRKVRMSEDSPNRAVAMFMLTSRGARGDVETARMAGVDGYLRKPISMLALQQRLRSAVLNPQPFIHTATYVGPCRRRRQDPAYAGPWRRLDDEATKQHHEIDVEDSDLKAELARASVAALEAAVHDLVAGDAKTARRVFRAGQDLCDVAEQIGDTLLSFGAKEMVRYLQAQGATARLDPEVVRTHVAALHTLVHLPHNLRSERERVANSLKKMVDKKLRQASSAA